MIQVETVDHELLEERLIDGKIHITCPADNYTETFTKSEYLEILEAARFNPETCRLTINW